MISNPRFVHENTYPECPNSVFTILPSGVMTFTVESFEQVKIPISS